MTARWAAALSALAAAASGQTAVGWASPDLLKPMFATSEALKPGFVGPRIADLDGDGILDGAWLGADGLYCAKGLGQGDFGPRTRLAPAPTRPSASDLALIDIDRDGDLDALFVRYDPAETYLYLNDGLGGFAIGTQAAFGVAAVLGSFISVEIADLDNDDDLDIVFGSDGAPLRVFVQGGGRFTEESFRAPGILQTTYDIELVDIDGDGFRDIVTANGGDWRAESNYVFFNDRRGHFVNSMALPGGAAGTSRVMAGDIDNDGDLDLVLAQIGTGSLLLRNDGGSFTDVSARLAPNHVGVTWTCALGDIDGDGDLDLVLAGYWFLHIYINDGAGRFSVLGRDGLWNLPYGPAFGTVYWAILRDFDNDGALDLLVVQGGVPGGSDIYFGTRSQIISTGVVPLGGSIPLHTLGEPGLAVLAFAGARVRTFTPLGTLWLDPASLIVDPLPIVIPAHGVAKRVLTIPNTPSLRGRTIQVQAVHVTSRWTQLTNGHRILSP